VEEGSRSPGNHWDCGSDKPQITPQDVGITESAQYATSIREFFGRLYNLL